MNNNQLSKNEYEDFTSQVLSYLDGDLSDQEFKRLEESLLNDKHRQQLFVDICLQSKLLSELPGKSLQERNIEETSGTITEENYIDFFDQDDWRSWVRSQKQETLTPEKSSFKTGKTTLLALAASLLIGFFLYQSLSTSQVGTVVDLSGTITLTRDNVELPLQKGMIIQSNDQIITDTESNLFIKLSDQTKLMISPETEFTISESFTEGKSVIAETGHIYADITKQPIGRPMVFRSSSGEATVRGTKLDFYVESEKTFLHVEEGKVSFTDSERDQVKLVQTGETAELNNANEFSFDDGGWPSSLEDLIFLFKTNNHPNAIFQEGKGPKLCELRANGGAHFNSNGEMDLQSGMFTAFTSSHNLLTDCQRSSELSVEVFIHPQQFQKENEVRIVSFSRHSQQMNFMLGQTDGKLVFRLTTNQTKSRKHGWAEFVMKDVQLDQWQHVVVTYQPGSLIAYLNGEKSFEAPIEGNFDNWERYPLTFGDDVGGGRHWKGLLQGVAIYSRALNRDEVRKNSTRYHEFYKSN